MRTGSPPAGFGNFHVAGRDERHRVTSGSFSVLLSTSTSATERLARRSSENRRAVGGMGAGDRPDGAVHSVPVPEGPHCHERTRKRRVGEHSRRAAMHSEEHEHRGDEGEQASRGDDEVHARAAFGPRFAHRAERASAVVVLHAQAQGEEEEHEGQRQPDEGADGCADGGSGGSFRGLDGVVFRTPPRCSNRRL